MSCPEDCECGGQTLGAVDASELHREHAARQSWAALCDAISDPGLIELTAAASAELACFVADHGEGFVRQQMRTAATELEHVRFLQQWAAEPDYPEFREKLAGMPEAVARADRTQAQLSVVADGIRLSRAAQAEPALLALTAEAETEQRKRMASFFTVRHMMMSDGGRARSHTLGAQRHRLGLQGTSMGAGMPVPPEDDTGQLRDAKPDSKKPRKRRRPSVRTRAARR